MSEREAFLARIRSRQSPAPTSGPHPPPPPPAEVPAMRYRNLDGVVDADALVKAFAATAREADATVDVVTPPDLDTRVPAWLDATFGSTRPLAAVVSTEPEVAAVAAILRRCDVEVVDYSPAVAERAQLAVTSATHGIAATGTVVVDSARAGSRAVSLLPRVHVCVLPAERIVPDPAAVLRRFSTPMPSARVLITGPSRTGDIEQRLTLGAHGPVALHVFVVTGS